MAVVLQDFSWKRMIEAVEAVKERTCRAAGFVDVRDISSPLANWRIGKFDWEPRGTGEWRRGGVNFRRMWICERPRKT